MNNPRKTSHAVRILHRRYVGEDAQRRASLERERVNAEVARTIYELREQAGLSQRELADRVDTTQSVISRLEDADYEGHSLSMLNRIAKALDQQVQVVMRPKERNQETVRLAFREVIRGLRKEQGLSLDQLGRKIDAPSEELAQLEQDSTYRPTPLMLHKLSRFFEIPQTKLALLAGAIKDIPAGFCQQASSFAAQSESFSKLTRQERKLLDDFVKFLRTEIKQE